MSIAQIENTMQGGASRPSGSPEKGKSSGGHPPPPGHEERRALAEIENWHGVTKRESEQALFTIRLKEMENRGRPASVRAAIVGLSRRQFADLEKKSLAAEAAAASLKAVKKESRIDMILKLCNGMGQEWVKGEKFLDPESALARLWAIYEKEKQDRPPLSRGQMLQMLRLGVELGWFLEAPHPTENGSCFRLATTVFRRPGNNGRPSRKARISKTNLIFRGVVRKYIASMKIELGPNGLNMVRRMGFLDSTASTTFPAEPNPFGKFWDKYDALIKRAEGRAEAKKVSTEPTGGMFMTLFPHAGYSVPGDPIERINLFIGEFVENISLAQSYSRDYFDSVSRREMRVEWRNLRKALVEALSYARSLDTIREDYTLDLAWAPKL